MHTRGRAIVRRLLDPHVGEWVDATDLLDEALRIGGSTLVQAAMLAVEKRDAYLTMLESGD